MALLLGFAALVVFLVIWVISVYNALVQLRLSVKNAWSQIDVQLKRRHDLIPNLVETAKGYMAHERETLEEVIKARQMAVDASSLKDRLAAENMLTSTLRSLMAVSENYPQLKADQSMLRVMEELTSTENKIGFARQFYNDEVNRYNSTLLVFPNNLVAVQFAFKSEEFFQLDSAGEKAAPQVKF